MAACQHLQWPRPCCSLPGHPHDCSSPAPPFVSPPSLTSNSVLLTLLTVSRALTLPGTQSSWSDHLLCFVLVFFSLSSGAFCGNAFTCYLFLLLDCMVMVNVQPHGVYEPCGLPGNKLLSPFHEKCFLILKVPWNPPQVCTLF